ncbi:hypothetical protein V8C86DRAFT_2856984 [Haematococcus lacustris]
MGANRLVAKWHTILLVGMAVAWLGVPWACCEAVTHTSLACRNYLTYCVDVLATDTCFLTRTTLQLQASSSKLASQAHLMWRAQQASGQAQPSAGYSAKGRLQRTRRNCYPWPMASVRQNLKFPQGVSQLT